MALKKRTDGNFLFCIYNRLNSTVSSNNKCFIFTLTGNKQAAPRLNSRNTIVQSCSVRPYFIVNIHTVYIMLNFIQRLRKVKMLIHSSEWHCHRLWKNFIYVNWSKCLLYKRLLLMPWKMSLPLSIISIGRFYRIDPCKCKLYHLPLTSNITHKIPTLKMCAALSG